MMDLSMQDAMRFPAKSMEKNGQYCFGISVYQHNLLTGFVLEELIKTLSFPAKNEVLPADVPALGGLHDIGKINPIFFGENIKK